ncbi:NIF family HAD-type phosphatase [Hyalangium versicolor]|uniref:NIF family HAD-type phosphatase n=1 Tax=Hyalangium versicolor TaxID=2861190 RepID=UPI001CCAFC64|nr:NIF family HAD-type phosphatase [Hyalangium versicolor]
MFRFSLPLLLATSLLGCAAAPATRPSEPPAVTGAGIASMADLDALTIPPLPAWVDKYADTNQGDQRFFNMSRVMERFKLVRAQAVELQNHYRDLTRATPGIDPVQAFNTALDRVLHNQFQSRLDLERIGKARFIVVFDLDETLWDQYYAPETGATCHDLVIREGKPPAGRYVKLTPGWQQAFERIQALGGAVVLFSANLEEPTLENLAQWKLDGVPLTESPAIAGILTNEHLILQDKSEGVTDPRKGSPIREPSKDLRIFDEELRRVIIVDDNPTRLFQMRNARIFKKFEADTYCGLDRLMHVTFDNALPQVVREIEDSVQYMNRSETDFATAFLPFTSLGQVTLRFLMESGRLDRDQAIDYVRHNPKSVDPRY